MELSYNKLWKLLIDKKISKADLRRMADIAPNTMTKLRKDEPVNMNILFKICDVLNCSLNDIMDYGTPIMPLNEMDLSYAVGGVSTISDEDENEDEESNLLRTKPRDRRRPR